jgi:hypothetical protein
MRPSLKRCGVISSLAPLRVLDADQDWRTLPVRASNTTNPSVETSATAESAVTMSPYAGTKYGSGNVHRLLPVAMSRPYRWRSSPTITIAEVTNGRRKLPLGALPLVIQRGRTERPAVNGCGSAGDRHPAISHAIVSSAATRGRRALQNGRGVGWNKPVIAAKNVIARSWFESSSEGFLRSRPVGDGWHCGVHPGGRIPRRGVTLVTLRRPRDGSAMRCIRSAAAVRALPSPR